MGKCNRNTEFYNQAQKDGKKIECPPPRSPELPSQLTGSQSHPETQKLWPEKNELLGSPLDMETFCKAGLEEGHLRGPTHMTILSFLNIIKIT